MVGEFPSGIQLRLPGTNADFVARHPGRFLAPVIGIYPRSQAGDEQSWSNPQCRRETKHLATATPFTTTIGGWFACANGFTHQSRRARKSFCKSAAQRFKVSSRFVMPCQASSWLAQ
jgi:hypothetical protein